MRVLGNRACEAWHSCPGVETTLQLGAGGVNPDLADNVKDDASSSLCVETLKCEGQMGGRVAENHQRKVSSTAPMGHAGAEGPSVIATYFWSDLSCEKLPSKPVNWNQLSGLEFEIL